MREVGWTTECGRRVASNLVVGNAAGIVGAARLVVNQSNGWMVGLEWVMERRPKAEGLEAVGDAVRSDPVESIYREIAELRRTGGSAALATIVETQGSSPARETMKMLVRADGTTSGSVGGGWFEAEVCRRALESLEADRTALFEVRFDREQAE